MVAGPLPSGCVRLPSGLLARPRVLGHRRRSRGSPAHARSPRRETSGSAEYANANGVMRRVTVDPGVLVQILGAAGYAFDPYRELDAAVRAALEPVPGRPSALAVGPRRDRGGCRRVGRVVLAGARGGGRVHRLPAAVPHGGSLEGSAARVPYGDPLALDGGSERLHPVHDPRVRDFTRRGLYTARASRGPCRRTRTHRPWVPSFPTSPRWCSSAISIP